MAKNFNIGDYVQIIGKRGKRQVVDLFTRNGREMVVLEKTTSDGLISFEVYEKHWLKSDNNTW